MRAGWVALGLLGAALVVVGTANVAAGAGERAVDALGFAAVGLACAALGVARWWPLAAAEVVTGALLVYVGQGYPDGPVLATGLVALYVLGAQRPRRVAYGAAVGMAAGVVVASVVADHGPGVIDLAFVGWAAAAVFAADAVRGRRERLAARDEQERLREQARERELGQRMVEERLRIARDLHDSVAHTMATINVQAGMAHHVIDSHPELAKEALETVRAVSEGALEELNAMVRVLRDEDERSPLRPAPGLAELPGLVDTATQAGVDVTLTVAGAPGPVAAPVGVAVYRIVQESLTNVARHAGAARATVAVVHSAAGIDVEIANDPPGGSAPPSARGSGVGITGMRERAMATSGTLSAGPRPDGGFRVHAHWPAGVGR